MKNATFNQDEEDDRADVDLYISLDLLLFLSFFYWQSPACVQSNDIRDIEPITDGEKVKWAYLSDNPFGFDTMALRGYQDPQVIVDFVEQYIDRNKIFEKELKNKLDDFYAAMNWGAFPENNSVAKFFSFGK